MATCQHCGEVLPADGRVFCRIACADASIAARAPPRKFSPGQGVLWSRVSHDGKIVDRHMGDGVITEASFDGQAWFYNLHVAWVHESLLDHDRRMSKTHYELKESKTSPGTWLVTAFDPDSNLWQTEFRYTDAQERAEEYVAWKNADR